jgi:hypothetical protein
MTDTSYINFTYKSPHEDVESVMGHNPDGSVNIKYTLLALRDLLTHNLNIVNKLLEKNDDIFDINPIGYGIVSIDANTITKESLLNANILIKQPNVLENEEILDDIYISDEEETNQNRLGIINNLVNLNDTHASNINTTDSDTDSDDIIDDKINTRSIVDKYLNIINEKYSDDDSSESEYLSAEEKEEL